MKAYLVLSLFVLMLLFLSIVHASAFIELSLPAGVNGTGVTYINVTDTISQSSPSIATSNIEYTVKYQGFGNINITLPDGADGVTLTLQGVPYAFSTINDVSCGITESQKNCTSIIIKNAASADTFVMLYSYKTSYPSSNGVFNSTFVLIPPQLSAIRVVMVLPSGAFLQSNPYYTPTPVNFSSNGQEIEVIWSRFQDTPGIVMPFKVSYDDPVSAPSILNYNSYIIAAIIIASMLLILWGMRHYREQPGIVSVKKKINPFKALLNADEKKVLGALHKDKFVGQNELITLTGFSKAKMSKIVSKLSRYKLIKLQIEGKYNKIKKL